MLSENTHAILFVLSFYHPICLINSRAPQIIAPDEPPTSNPSLAINLLAKLKEGWSSDLIQWSICFRAHVLGIKSYPMPSTLLGGPSTLSSFGMARILPMGSTPTTKVLGHLYLIFLLIPAIVPPVPTPTTTASSLSSSWYRISSASWS